MSWIYSAEEMQKWDQFTIQNKPISSIELMERAAITCAKHILGSFIIDSVAIFCGKGNNGGDGLAIARLLASRGIKVIVYICENDKKGSPDFEANLARLPKKVKRIQLKAGDKVKISGDLIIDAIFGTGLNRPIDNWIGGIITQLNTAKKPIVSIDLPSGLLATDNRENTLEHCVKATKTLTFQAPKMAFFYSRYVEYVGRFSVLNIDLSTEFTGHPIAYYIQASAVVLRQNSTYAHKGNKGYLSLIAGSDRMLGSALLSAKAGFKTGCGYVGILSTKTILTPLAVHLPEAIWMGESWIDLAEKTTAIAIGPGIGQSENAKLLVEATLSAGFPLVIDADGLNCLAADPKLLEKLPKNAILTPHLGELNRLIGDTNSPEECLERQIAFSAKYGVYVIQKGAFSKLTCPDGSVYVNSTGNSAMASAGMGDALTGMIGSFLAQGYAPSEAAIYGMYYHGLAGDKAVEFRGYFGLLTSDLIEAIPTALNQL